MSTFVRHRLKFKELTTPSSDCMKHILPLLLISFLSLPFSSDSVMAQTIDSTIQYGSSGSSSIHAIATDHNGNTYVAGYVVDTVWINNQYPLAGSKSGSLLYLASFTEDGAIRFTRLFSTGIIAPIQLEVDDSNNLFLSTLFVLNKVYLNPELTEIIAPGYGEQAFILKMNDQGKNQWYAYSYGTKTNSNMKSFEFSLSENGEVICLGSAKGGISIHTSIRYNYAGFSSVGNENSNRYGAILFRTNPHLITRYPTATFGNSNASISEIALAERAGKIVFAGQLNGTVDFDLTAGVKELTSSGRGFYCCVDTQMNLQWVKPSVLHRFSKLRINSFNQIKGFGTHPGVGVARFEMSSIDFDGNFQYEYTEDFSSSIMDVSDAAVDGGGHVFVTGTFGGYGDFDPTSKSATAGTSNAGTYLVKYDSSGQTRWFITGTGTGVNTNKGLAVNLSKNNQLLWGGTYSRNFYFSGNNAQSPPNSTHVLGFLAHLTECRSLQGGISPRDTAICDGETVPLQVFGGRVVSWADDTITSSVRSIMPDQSQFMEATITNDTGCFKTVNSSIVVNPIPTATIELKDSGCMVQGAWNTIRWYLNNQLVAVENNGFYAPKEKGTVQCEVEDSNGCIGTSNQVMFIPSSIGLNLLDQARWYTVNKELFVQFQEEMGPVTIALLDSRGATVFSDNVPAGLRWYRSKLNLSDGVYTLMLKDHHQNVIGYKRVMI
ncbi:MAG: hypothetical protein KDC76_02605 [Bacteroidetes bacterium]|nr:hypothetical protein [Bacteroidota bacterium]